jgi:hypothetical protein
METGDIVTRRASRMNRPRSCSLSLRAGPGIGCSLAPGGGILFGIDYLIRRHLRNVEHFVDTRQFARQLAIAIDHTIRAHGEHPRTPNDRVRFHDSRTPYAIHPIWCAMTLLSETTLPFDLRVYGYQALLWHDLLEDTHLILPEGTAEDVRVLVGEMTFASFAEEREQIWQRSQTAQLLKLYDKVSNLLDGSWMSDAKWNDYVAHPEVLAQFASERFGNLNIVRIARAIAIHRGPRGAATDRR